MMARFAALAALVAGAAVAGCSHGAGTTSSPAGASGPAPAPSAGIVVPNPSSSASVAPAAPTAEPDGAPPGTRTCTELGAAISNGSLMEPGVVSRIVAAAATADAPIADAARRLGAAYTAAAASTGTTREADEVAAVSAAAADMDGVCDESGLESNG